MRAVDPASLVATLDHVTEAFLKRQVLPNPQRREVADFLASRFEQKGSYAGMPAPTPRDFARPFRLFTGEAVNSSVGRSHILGQEACRAALLLDVHTPDVIEPLERATRAMLMRLAPGDRKAGSPTGFYCCCTCTVAMWRHLCACGLDHQDDRLRAGLRVLASRRAAGGRWRGYPFYYTLLALLDMHVIEAQDELEHAAPAVAALLRQTPRGAAPYASRRRLVLERVADRVGVEVGRSRHASGAGVRAGSRRAVSV